MIIENYTDQRAVKLEKTHFPEITEPFNIKVMWLHFLSYKNCRNRISTTSHQHSYFEAHFVVSGSVEYKTEKGIYTVSEGKALLISPENRHIVSSLSDDFVKCTIAFVPHKDSFMYRGFACRGELLFDMTDKIKGCFEDILEESEKKSVMSAVLMKNRIFDILSCISRLAGIKEELADSSAFGGDVRIARIRQYIGDNKGVFFTCSEIASRFHFNPRYLNRIFREETGCSLLEYIHRTKIAHAEKLLSDTGQSLESISKELGFANEYYFNSFFKRCTGITPGYYRKLSRTCEFEKDN